MGWCNITSATSARWASWWATRNSLSFTVLRHFAQNHPGVLYIEAWPQMRVGDMLEAIARPLGLSCAATTTTGPRI